MRVSVYKNLHKECWSFKETKPKARVQHADVIVLVDCKFRVGIKGRERVLKERQKNVHARIYGIMPQVETNSELRQGMVEVTYDPYKNPYFYVKETEERVDEAKMVIMKGGRVFAYL